MKNHRTQKQIEASRRNGQNSNGPKTSSGRAVSRMNALKHGILSQEVVVQGLRHAESSREFQALHQRFREELNPTGPVEEMLVDQIVTTHWRLRRALKAESGEVVLSMDNIHAQQKRGLNPTLQLLQWKLVGNPVASMEGSSMGVSALEMLLGDARMAVEKDDGLNAAFNKVLKWFDGRPNRLTRALEKFRCEPETGTADAETSLESRKKNALAWLDVELGRLGRLRIECEELDHVREQAENDAAFLPPMEVLEKILRYETKLERRQYRAMIHLERLQRMRRGEAVPPPIQLEVAERP